jgi:hypothetical protein
LNHCHYSTNCGSFMKGPVNLPSGPPGRPAGIGAYHQTRFGSAARLSTFARRSRSPTDILDSVKISYASYRPRHQP